MVDIANALSKYDIVQNAVTVEKECVVDCISRVSGIIITTSELQIDKQICTVQISSVKKDKMLRQKAEILSELHKTESQVIDIV
jgi:hypothetical protein